MPSPELNTHDWVTLLDWNGGVTKRGDDSHFDVHLSSGKCRAEPGHQTEPSDFASRLVEPSRETKGLSYIPIISNNHRKSDVNTV